MKFARAARWGSAVIAPSMTACLDIADVAAHDAGAGAGDGQAAIDGGTFPGHGGSSAADASAGGGGGAGGATAGGASGSGGGGGQGGSATTIMTLKPGGDLAGDGFLARPNLCGAEVHDSYPQNSYEAIHVGRDVPCEGVATYRAFLRFELHAVKGPVQKATLRLFYAQKTDPQAGVGLWSIPDFKQLAASSWDLPLQFSYGTVITPSSPEGWIEKDVSNEVKLAQLQGEAAAFELRYLDEAQDPAGSSRWYGIVAADHGTLGPELVVEY